MTFDELPAQVEQLRDRLEFLVDKMDPERPITSEEASEYLSLSLFAVRSLASQGTLPSHKRGKRHYFFKSELVKWIKAEGENG